MSSTKYNGWTNRETWLVNVWFEPVTKYDVFEAQDVLEQQHDEMPNGLLKDMLDLSLINWNELQSACKSEFEEETE